MKQLAYENVTIQYKSMSERGNPIQYCVETWQPDPMLWRNVEIDPS